MRSQVTTMSEKCIRLSEIRRVQRGLPEARQDTTRKALGMDRKFTSVTSPTPSPST